jgi:hypothetical protein
LANYREMSETPMILVIHAAATWGMAGAIWFIQMVHYPAYRDIGAAEFATFQTRATARTGFFVGPLMFTEAGTAAGLLWQPPAGIATVWLWIGALLIVVCWASTIFVQVPIHLRLSSARDPATVDRLVRSNWVRTIAWSLRAALVAAWLLRTNQR